MSRTPEDLELLQELEAAQREAVASEAVTARARSQRSAPARQKRQRRRVGILGLCVVVAAVVAWSSFRVDGPSEVDLRHAPQAVLMLAAQWTRDYVRSHGRFPSKLGEDLPVAANVKLQPDSHGVRLSIQDEEGAEHTAYVSVVTRP